MTVIVSELRAFVGGGCVVGARFGSFIIFSVVGPGCVIQHSSSIRSTFCFCVPQFHLHVSLVPIKLHEKSIRLSRYLPITSVRGVELVVR